ncbi:division/cell wall cluster transcriptional repressor MraZ [Patescibacteria group bacterium]|nr:division/cell wall cluster transcriptional repressor MraZ [Patescibacteria group bacterium]MBU1563886.1 division/cell wall cluster transcriptional repressor MraZ [Patescibacteria group bacterium]MBU2068538.1 division/cell wall cluster transcriptional repressor MraZ [Patescibacteria group bacterium]
MLIGEYKHILDTKKRLAIPVKFRRFFSQGAVITRGVDNCLVLYSLKEWEEIAGKLGKLPTSQVEARSFARVVLAGAMSVKFDRLGRILVPDYLKKYALLKKNAVIIGLYNRLEVWSEERWEVYRQRAEKNVDDLASKLGELGL